MMMRRHDRLALKIFWLGLRNRFRETRIHDRLLLSLGSILCLLWPLSDLRDLLHSNAVTLRNSPAAAVVALAIFILLGAGFGMFSTGLAWAAGNANFLRVQPLSKQSRRRMAAFAAAAGGICTAPAAAVVLAAVCVVIHKPKPVLWGLAAALAYVAGAGLGLAGRLDRLSDRAVKTGGMERRRRYGLAMPSWMARLDRAVPAFLSSWSAGLVEARLPLAKTQGLLVLLLAEIMASIASLADHRAAPAAPGAVVAGLAAFMLLARCHPLRSPVLRTAPIGLFKAWFGMLRLPLLVSAIFFAAPAGAALAAQPSAWVDPAGGGFSLLLLDGAYGIFAAFFPASPLIAAASFVTVLLYASYKLLTYHGVVYACFAGLLVLMWVRVARSFNDGP